ncbi:hypothetical protein DFH06DRAFT_404599 [Mycena polygramma]|nr:hypothetical protein DFH06DRAFT_404599 [Mycena polygramma]
MPFETAPSPKPVFRHSPKPVFRKARSSPRVAPGPSNRSRQRKRAPSPANVDSDRDADSESTGDASDDEYVPSPSLNPRKRTRSASPSSSSLHRTSASPPASSSGSSSGRPNKRARLPPPSRNKQASPAEIKRVVETADDFTDFVCGVCGWVQKNGRLPDFKRHVKTHQRTFDEGSHKGWRCKGVPLDEALNWGVAADAETYTFMGRERVGGCMKTFSRRDALKRHLDNENVSCVGRPTAPTAD